ncbi:MAG: alpha/beta hydrolase [Chitinophagaceae bacterium]|nr:alpha/beta hydrolase [Chitinophagaceae bacterium]
MRPFIILPLYLLCLSFLVSCKSGHTAAKTKGYFLTDSLYSKVLGEMRYYDWYEPVSTLPQPSKGILIVLDGQALLGSTVETVKALATEPGLAELNDWIVLGIGNIWKRDRDYTPSRQLQIPHMDSMSAAQTGAVFPFLQFMEQELMPVINRRYPQLKHRILLGHSFGGLAVLECFVRKPGLFTHYITAEPSIWWPAYEPVVTPLLLKQHDHKPFLYMAVGNVPDHTARFEQILADSTGTYPLQQPGVRVLNTLQRQTTGQKWFKGRFFANDDHQSIVQPACCAALRFFLKKENIQQP